MSQSNKKGAKCPALNVYERLLHFLLHDIAWKETFKRGVLQTLVNIVTSIIAEGREDDVRQWIGNFQKRSAWEMLSDEDDLAIVLQRITVMPDRKMKIWWLDGKQSICHLPKYSPKKGIEYDDKQ